MRRGTSGTARRATTRDRTEVCCRRDAAQALRPRMRNTCKCSFFSCWLARLKIAVTSPAFACVRLVVLAPIQSRGDVAGLPPVRSHELVEAFLTASPLDHDAAVCRRPYVRPGDQRLTGKRPEPIPDRRFECVAELVTSIHRSTATSSSPSVRLSTILSSATASASSAAERDRGDRRAAPLKLLPDGLFGHELVPSGPEPRLMRLPGLAFGGHATRLSRNGPARRASPRAPPACDVEPVGGLVFRQ